eukprot:2156725-Pleurochrysis_carterae.AAC.1
MRRRWSGAKWSSVALPLVVGQTFSQSGSSDALPLVVGQTVPQSSRGAAIWQALCRSSTSVRWRVISLGGSFTTAPGRMRRAMAGGVRNFASVPCPGQDL